MHFRIHIHAALELLSGKRLHVLFQRALERREVLCRKRDAYGRPMASETGEQA